jgi:hypothetical protein
VGAERIMRGQVHGHLPGQLRGQPPRLVQACELGELIFGGIGGELTALLIQGSGLGEAGRPAHLDGERVTPEAVSATWWVLRSSRRVPGSRSSRCTCRLSADWTMCSRSAARPKCSSSASVTK